MKCYLYNFSMLVIMLFAGICIKNYNIINPGRAQLERIDSVGTLDKEVVHCHEYILWDSVEATCLIKGYKRYICSCGAKISELTPVKQHEIVLVGGYEPTYIANGKEPDKCCSNCHKVIEGGKIIPVKLSGLDGEEFVVPEYISSLSNKSVSAFSGYTPKVDKYNRPVLYVDLQKKYGKYNSYFLGTQGNNTMYLYFTAVYDMYDKKLGKYHCQLIMDICEEKNVPVTFFVTGEFVKRYPFLVKEMVERGFTIGNHCYDHSSGIRMYNKSITDQVQDLVKFNKLLKDTVGGDTVLFCPSYGAFSEQTLALAYELGYKTVLFSGYYFDYDAGNEPDRDTFLEIMTNRLHDGETLYLHTLTKATISILPEIIDSAREKGLNFGSLLDIE